MKKLSLMTAYQKSVRRDELDSATMAQIKECTAKSMESTTPAAGDCDELVGESPGIRELKDLIHRVAPRNTTVLITGETGTGKEVVARLLHRLSLRSRARMVCVNCAAIPETLLESELFGHESGAFTGASRRHPGQIRLAQGGTLFLDEVGDMSLVAQSKLLRVLEHREVRPLGGSRSTSVDVRMIAATHQRLEQMVAVGTFRSDLFYRIRVVCIEIPPLRDRLEDVPLLARHFLTEFSKVSSTDTRDFSDGAMERLMEHDWPGNVRELRNVIETATMLGRSDVIGEDDLRGLKRKFTSAPLHRTSSGILTTLPPGPEIDRLMKALRTTNWNVTRTARMLQWSRMTVYRKVAKYGVERPSGEPPPPEQLECGGLPMIG
jgi:transcriptional regulator with PAS, ATPase and Fis domain